MSKAVTFFSDAAKQTCRHACSAMGFAGPRVAPTQLAWTPFLRELASVLSQN